MLSRELEKLHNVWVSVRILNAGLRNSNGLRIVCAAFTNVVTLTDAGGIIVENGEWPNSNNGSVEGTVYRLMLALDARLSAELWEQERLPTA
jgi:hypothetical protein